MLDDQVRPSIARIRRRRERQQQLFKSQASAQRFLTIHAALYNTFYTQKHFVIRPQDSQLVPVDQGRHHRSVATPSAGEVSPEWWEANGPPSRSHPIMRRRT